MQNFRNYKKVTFQTFMDFEQKKRTIFGKVMFTEQPTHYIFIFFCAKLAINYF